MTTQMPGNSVRRPRVRAAPRACGHRADDARFTVEILDDAAAARIRVKDLIPEGARVFTGASETLRLSGIDEDINASGRYRPSGRASWPWTVPPRADDIRRLLASPDVVVGSVAALTERAPSWSPRAAEASCPATQAAPPARSGSSGRRRWYPT